jgi:hypothetical protein
MFLCGYTCNRSVTGVMHKKTASGAALGWVSGAERKKYYFSQLTFVNKV